jgi:hypothetical protein
MVSGDSVSDITVEETFSSFNDFSLLIGWISLLITWLARFYSTSSPEPWLANAFRNVCRLDAASNDGDAGVMSLDCQIFVFEICDTSDTHISAFTAMIASADLEHVCSAFAG